MAAAPAHANLVEERPTFASHLECSATGATYPADEVHGLSAAGKPLLVRYDLAAAARVLDRDALAARPADLWRYRELLPVRRAADIVSLGETMTPLIALPRTAARHGATGEVLVKDDSRLPTGSFKARGLAMAVSMAKSFGLKRLAMPTNGNAGAALAAYCRRAGMAAYVFCPANTPEVSAREISLQGAEVWRIDGMIDECGALIGAGAAAAGWFDLSTHKEPYRIEGKKTMGLELAEQLGWQVPDAIFCPTGGGTGMIAIWKAIGELAALGWIGDARPRIIAVQAAGCAPLVRAWDAGADAAERWDDAHTVATGIRVPSAISDFLMLRTLRESDGFAIAVDDRRILAAQAEVARDDGLLVGPEGAATIAAWQQAVADGRIARDARVVLFNCGSALKYPMPPADRTLSRAQPIDYTALVAANG